jgi:hypothetical protein
VGLVWGPGEDARLDWLENRLFLTTRPPLGRPPQPARLVRSRTPVVLHRQIQGVDNILTAKLGRRSLARSSIGITSILHVVGHEIVAVKELFASILRHAGRLVSKEHPSKVPEKPLVFTFGIFLVISNNGKIDMVQSVNDVR